MRTLIEMLMVAKKRIRVASELETDDIVDEGEMPDFSSQAMLISALNPDKHGKQVPVSKLKDIGSEVTSTRKLGSVQSPSVQSGKYPETDGSNCARMGPRSSERGLEIADHRNPIQRDIEAALILMQLSNDNSELLKTNMQSPSSMGACHSQRNQNTKKVGKRLRLLKLKKTAERTYLGRQVELDCHCIKDEKVLEESELPISFLKRKKLPKSSSEKSRSKKLKAEPGSFEGSTAYSFVSVSQVGNSTVQEPKSFKKPQFSSRCPTVHTGFSFSVIHLLTAIRTAMITLDGKDERKRISNSQGEKKSLPCLTMHEIVERVRLNPGDPCILEAREPLLELVRGALTIFSSTTAPLGAKAWKALTLYTKFNKSWSWIGPVAIKPHNHIKEAVSSEAWGLPNRTLLKLINCYANWLKIARESLQKIGDLPAPPLTLMHKTVIVKERLGEVRPRKTMATISQCPKEVRDYFRKEEAIRYSVPERAFSYTALDGRKSTVAPLRRCSGKPSLKCREHFMLKADRPPNATVLSLVRDAAARLPSGLGTRADVCVLIRDSQYIVEEISEEKLNQVVSGALDRLHYEHDPCVRFNGEKRLWFYLHGDREVDDFEYDATSSTKKRRRQ